MPLEEYFVNFNMLYVIYIALVGHNFVECGLSLIMHSLFQCMRLPTTSQKAAVNRAWVQD
ncbi:hypothetical protein A7976_00695 [Methylobacillus sp. MM3]|nr:hypothetical protein A7976_00695 [Methylobacillus sp. MM3]